jgi:uncharacterized membrane protein YgdD (TMEM256/DUF423 family)
MSRWAYGLVALAGLSGVAGVMEAAAAAHSVADPRLATAAHFLILNAAAGIAITGFARGSQSRTWFLVAAGVLLSGGVLFSADLSLRVFAGARLFAFAAPLGGILMIIGWLLTALIAFYATFSRRAYA